MKENLQKAHSAINALVEDIKRVIRENGGIIDTQSRDCARIKTYIYENYGGEAIYVKCDVMGIKVVNDKLFVLPAYGSYYTFGRTDVKSVEDSEWFEIRTRSGLLTAQTILSIAEVINQYI